MLDALARLSSLPFGHALTLRVLHLDIPLRRRVAKVTIERVRMRGTSQRATLCARRLWRWRERRIVVIAHDKSIQKTSTNVNTFKHEYCANLENWPKYPGAQNVCSGKSARAKKPRDLHA